MRKNAESFGMTVDRSFVDRVSLVRIKKPGLHAGLGVMLLSN
jgi:hypothetical protein